MSIWITSRVLVFHLSRPTQEEKCKETTEAAMMRQETLISHQIAEASRLWLKLRCVMRIFQVLLLMGICRSVFVLLQHSLLQRRCCELREQWFWLPWNQLEFFSINRFDRNVSRSSRKRHACVWRSAKRFSTFPVSTEDLMVRAVSSATSTCASTSDQLHSLTSCGSENLSVRCCP